MKYGVVRIGPPRVIQAVLPVPEAKYPGRACVFQTPSFVRVALSARPVALSPFAA